MRVINYLDFGIFPGHVLLSSGYTYDELYIHLNDTGADNWAAGLSNDKELIDGGNYFALMREIMWEGSSIKLFYVIMRDPFQRTDYEYTKLAHEIVHICQFYLPDVLDRNREIEAEAYLHTHLMMQVLNHLK